MTLIALCGKSGHGKDTLAAEMVEHFGFTRIAFADKLKAEVQKGIREKNDPFFQDQSVQGEWSIGNYRRIYQLYGQHMRELEPTHWTYAVFNTVLADPNRRWVITDCRYVDEASSILAYDGDLIILNRVDEKGLTFQNLKPPMCNHPSEIESEYIYDVLGKGWGLRMHRLTHSTVLGLKVTGMSIVQTILNLPYGEELDIAKLYASEIAEAVGEE